LTELDKPKRVLIAGASRGLGLGLARTYLQRGWDVFATVRNDAGEQALVAIGSEIGRAPFVARMDILSNEDVTKLRRRLEGVRFDILFVNAGITNDPSQPIETVSSEEFQRIMLTNVFAPMRFVGMIGELVARDGVVAVMSSNMGSVSGNEGGGWDVYKASKSALNQAMKSFAARRHGDGKTYLLVSPGWVRTEMGGENAPLDIETSTAGIADVIAQRAGQGGVLFVDYRNSPVSW
jgi:NAD(P)-dependent dehydrogenase (short-subunit alcohol dehydrogenase family)